MRSTCRRVKQYNHIGTILKVEQVTCWGTGTYNYTVSARSCVPLILSNMTSCASLQLALNSLIFVCGSWCLTGNNK